MVSVVATLVSAALLWAAFPPLDIGILVFIAPAPFLWVLRRIERPAHAAWLGFLFAATFYGILLRWIFLLGAVAWFPLTIVMGAFGAAFAIGVWAVRTLPPHRWWLAVVGFWALWEFLRDRIPFGGFPWGSLGTAAGGLTWPRGAAQWIGATGWSVLVVAIAAGLVVSLEFGGARMLAASLAVVVVFSLAGAIWAPSADGGSFRVAVVQGSTPCPRVHCDNEADLIYESHLELTRTLEPGVFDLVVWPENSTRTPAEPLGNPEVFAAISGEASRLNSYVMVSGTRQSEIPGKFLNANLLFSRKGDLIGEYRKQHPVPFGEYVPFREYLDFISALDAVPQDMEQGPGPVVFDLPEGVLGSVISFEGAFARSVRSEVREGADLMVVTSNEGSYGRTEASDQFIGITRMRAAELGTPLVHAAISGKSTLIDADGSFDETTGLFLKDVLIGELQWRAAGPTLYARFGDWLQLLAIFGGVLAVAWPRSRQTPHLFTPPWSRPAARPVVRQ
jgi:apolipoprotein N-acyltransferase